MENERARRRQLYGLLGDLPPRRRPIRVEKVWDRGDQDYILEKLILDLNGFEPVPAYFARPHGQAEKRATVLYNHAHGGDYELGKDELIRGREVLQQPFYDRLLTRMNYNTLCIDHWAFGERKGRRESEIFKEMLWKGRVMWGMMVYDSLRAVDYLCARADVDKTRLATLGLSMGSTMAWWLAALDPRIKVCIDICCLTEFEALIEASGLDGHGIYYYVPRLLCHFSAGQINALIAPRPHLSLAGNLDTLTPPPGLDRLDREIGEAYRDAGAPEAWKLVREDVGHEETPSMRSEIVAFLERWL